MAICFLFTNHLEDEGCLSLKLNDDGSCLEPPEHRRFDEIRNSQANAKTIAVIGAELASILTVELPKINEKKARAAIPYALEDHLAQPLDKLHFAFDQQLYHHHSYLVVVIEKLKLEQVIEALKNKAIAFDSVTLDWFALNENELCLTNEKFLIHQGNFKGAMSLELADLYLKNPPAGSYYAFEDSSPIKTVLEFEKINQPSLIWLSQRLHNKKILNLCQGDYQQQEMGELWMKRGYQLLGLLAVVWLVFMILADFFTIHSLNNSISILDKKIEVIFKEFFPDAKQVISPKFRISQLIGNASESSQTKFWQLMSHLSNALNNSDARVEQLNYEKNRLVITVACPDFASLEALEDHLKQLQIKVKQTQAASRDKQVIATLELM